MDPSELADSTSENDSQQQTSQDTADVSRTVSERFPFWRKTFTLDGLCQSDSSVKFKILSSVCVNKLTAIVQSIAWWSWCFNWMLVRMTTTTSMAMGTMTVMTITTTITMTLMMTTTTVMTIPRRWWWWRRRRRPRWRWGRWRWWWRRRRRWWWRRRRLCKLFVFSDKNFSLCLVYLRLVSIHRLLLCQTKTAKKMRHCHLVQERMKRNQGELRCLHLCQQHRETPVKKQLNPLHQIKEKVQQQGLRQNVLHYHQQPNQAGKGKVLLPRNFPRIPQLKNGKFLRWNCPQQSLQNLQVPPI